MSKKNPTPRITPQKRLLTATEAMEFLNVSRAHFYEHILKTFDLEPVYGIKKHPMYRIEVLEKVRMGRSGQKDHKDVDAAPLPTAGPEKSEASLSERRSVLAIDAGFKVTKGFEHITVEEWHTNNRMLKAMKKSAHLPDFDWPPQDDEE